VVLVVAVGVVDLGEVAGVVGAVPESEDLDAPWRVSPQVVRLSWRVFSRTWRRGGFHLAAIIGTMRGHGI
jgi:hypothetical protein